MKQYKLIKKYPNSLRLGAILLQTEMGYVEIEQTLTIGQEKYYPAQTIENNPEFWQEITSSDGLQEGCGFAHPI